MVAAVLLTALGGSLALLAQPSAAASVDSYDIRASVRFGCAQDKGEDDFVEVGLSAVEQEDFADRELVLQVGLASPGSDGYGVYTEGGPSLVTLGESPLKVRLASPPHPGDHVFLRQLDRPEIIKLPLPATCHRIKPTNFGLDEPDVSVTTKSCTPGSQANLRVTLQNPNEVDRRLQRIGIEQIDYTVLLVRDDGQLAGAEPVGTLVSFDEPSASSITLSQVVSKPARYQVRVIGLDGSVTTSRSIRLSCASTGPVPAPSTSARPSPSVSVSRPGSTPPNSSRPAPSTPARPPTATVSRPPASPAPTSSAPSRTPASSAPAGPATSAPPTRAPATSAPAQRPPAASSSAAGSAGGPSNGDSASRPAPTPRPSGSAAQPSATPSRIQPPSSAPAGTASPSPTSSADSTIIRLVEPRSDYNGLPVFQREVALVVLVFAAAMAALVGMTVVNARRR
jgi:hypothetical protein